MKVLTIAERREQEDARAAIRHAALHLTALVCVVLLPAVFAFLFHGLTAGL